MKHNDERTLKLKERIETHGNEDDLKSSMSSNCTSCLTTGLRIIQSTASLLGWNFHKEDVKYAFLKTGLANRDA